MNSRHTENAAAALRGALAPVQARWAQASAGEQRLARAMGLVLALALVWFVALQPALSTLRSAQTQGPQLRAQLQTMRQLQAQAQALQAQARARAQTPESKPSDLLEAALATLGGKARLSLNGDRATVSLEGSDADALAQWLAQVRLNVRARALELHLTQSQGLWRGTIVLQLPRTSAP